MKDKKKFLQRIKDQKKFLQSLIISLALSGILTLLVSLGLLDNIDQIASDAWYQTPTAFDGDIVLVGIDQRALDELGPYDRWGREVMADVIEYLNVSEECRPAAIALDVLYTGASSAEADARLIAAAKAYGNVIVGCTAIFEDGFVEGADGTFSWNRFIIKNFDGPFDELAETANLGHINAMLDADGILRHHLLSITLPDGRVIPSMALQAAEQFRAFHGLPKIDLPSTDSNGFWYVPFCGKPETIWENISVADLVYGKTPADYFAGKIVLIGAYAPGLQDSYFTSIDHAKTMYGVEFHANVIQNLLWGEYRKEAGDVIQIVVLFILLALATAVFLKGSVKISTAVWLLLAAGWAGLSRLMYKYGIVLHVLWVPVSVTVLYVMGIADNYIREALEKSKINKTFRRYVAPEIVEKLLNEGNAPKLGGEETEIAVLFVDVRGFTPMSEGLEPTRVVEILNRYLTLVSDCILNRHGTLDKFIGDAAMAFWGAPLPHEDPVMEAVLAAMDMVEGSKELSKELKVKYDSTVSFGIGIHVGKAVVGNIGSLKRMDYTAIGDTVNTAARLEANAPGGEIYISREVVNKLEKKEHHIRAKSHGYIKLKGKKEDFEVLTLEEIID